MEQHLERIIQTSDSVGPGFLRLGLERAKAVGRILIGGESGRIVGMANGFLISNSHILTCHHVIESPDTALRSRIEFDFFVRDDGSFNQPVQYQLSPGELFAANAQLDITVVKLADAGGLADRPHIRLPGSDDNLVVGERMSSIHHSDGEPLRFLLRGPGPVSVEEDFFYYTGHSGTGSGAPLFNDQWTLVGVHHASVPARDGHGRILARDGSVWAAGSETEIQWMAREAIRASRVAEWLDAEGLSDLNSVESVEVVSPRPKDRDDTSRGFIPEPDSPTRDSVFISYAHADQETQNWKDRLALQLRAIPSIGETRIWEDSRIQPGQDWLREIEYALQRTRVAIFLVGPHFLNSQFILTKELPPLIEAAQADGVRIFPLITDYSPYSLSVLSKYQSFNDPLEPLESLPRSEQNRTLLELATEVAQVFGS